MNASSGDEVNNDEDAPETPCDVENMNASSDYEGNNDEVAPDLPTNDENINNNSEMREIIMILPLIHLQVVEMMKQLTMMKKKIMNKRPRRKKATKT